MLLKRLFWVCATLIFLNAPDVFAHGDHQHPPMEPLEAEQAALRTAQYFSQNDAGLGFGQLAASWNQLTPAESKIVKSDNGYFIVAVTNAKENRILYVLMSDEGDIYDANFSGEFPKLK